MCVCVCVCVRACLSTSFIRSVHSIVSNYYFCIVLSHIRESGGALLAYLVRLLPRVANEEVHVAQCQAPNNVC